MTMTILMLLVMMVLTDEADRKDYDDDAVDGDDESDDDTGRQRSLVEPCISYLKNCAVRASERRHRRNLSPQPRTLNHPSTNAECGLKGWMLKSSPLGATAGKHYKNKSMER